MADLRFTECGVGRGRWDTGAAAILLTLSLLSCTSPTAPPPTGPNATITGTVVERVDRPPYSYLRLKTDKGEVWAAVPMDSVSTGKKVTITHGAALKNFQAPRLGRRFDLVVFGTMEKG